MRLWCVIVVIMCRSAIGLVTAALIGLCSKAVQSDLDSSEGIFVNFLS